MTGQKCRIVIAGLVVAAQLAFAAVQTATVRVSIPGYEVTRLAGLDEATIPGGQLLETEPGRPIVPYYTEKVEYPAGTRIQDVKLNTRQGLKTDSGLRLPAVSDDTIAVDFGEITPGEYPKQEFAWNQLDDPEKTVLLIDVFPFRYDPKATTVEFHQEYAFEVSYVQSGVGISGLGLDPPACEPGQGIAVWVGLENTAAPIAIRLTGAVCRGTEVLTELPVRSIEKLGPVDTVRLDLTTGGYRAGEYLFRAVVTDRNGDELARAEEPYRLGVPQGEVTVFAVEPECFEVGDDVELTLDFRNTGSTTLSGDCVFRIMKAGEVIDELRREMTGLRPGASRTFQQSWNTAGAAKSAVYHAVGFVKYEGTASEFRSVMFSTNLMPIASFTFSPESSAVEEEVRFDATPSTDEDGEIVEYQWEFGDGGEAEGVAANHIYPEPGDFVVKLTVTDDGGRTATAEKTVPVSE